MRALRWAIITFAAILITGCATVDITKTAKGYYEPTDPDFVEILHTKPERSFLELGSMSTTGWETRDTAKMHNALRAKAAPLGADAVIILNSGITPGAYGSRTMWSTAIAIKYQ